PESRPAASASLRRPLEDRLVRTGRIHATADLPAAFHLVASANPCPCGWHGSDERICICPLGALERYRAKLSGPILDRMDLQVRVGNVALADMRSPAAGEASDKIRERVEAA